MAYGGGYRAELRLAIPHLVVSPGTGAYMHIHAHAVRETQREAICAEKTGIRLPRGNTQVSHLLFVGIYCARQQYCKNPEGNHTLSTKQKKWWVNVTGSE